MTSRSRYTAFLDANILYSAAVRDIFMEVALSKMYRRNGQQTFIENGWKLC